MCEPAAQPFADGDISLVPEDKLRRCVRRLNTLGGLDGAFDEDAIAIAARGLHFTWALSILKQAEESTQFAKIINKKWTVATYVVAALRKAGGGRTTGSDVGEAFADRIWKRIDWPNRQGGFRGQMNYDQITDAAQGSKYVHVLRGPSPWRRSEVRSRIRPLGRVQC